MVKTVKGIDNFIKKIYKYIITKEETNDEKYAETIRQKKKY